jgi:DinB superfamily
MPDATGVAVFCLHRSQSLLHPEVMAHDLQDSIALLERTPPALDSLLRGLPEVWTHHNEGGQTFTVVDVVGHLIHADKADWMPRACMILEHGENKPFDPFDRRGYVEECRGKNLPQLLDEFRQVRAACLDDLRALNLRPEQLEMRGHHPALGPVTLSNLLATWVTHDLTHLHQISRIMAHQYRDEVGPFEAFLGVLKCNGHGG